MPDPKLIDILPSEFDRNTLTRAERDLLEKAPKGEPVDCREYEPEKIDPSKAKTWSYDRAIRAEIISWLSTDEEAKAVLKRAGTLYIIGARIDGELGLSCVDIPFRLGLVLCSIKDGVDLSDARTRTISLSGTYTKHLTADRIETGGSVFLNDKFTATGEVRLPGAKIGGDLYCNNGRFIGPFALTDANIGGNFLCKGGVFENKGGMALVADRIETVGSVFLNDKFTATGEVRLIGAKIGGDLACRGGTFKNENGETLSADRIETVGSVFLNDKFTATGEVRLIGAKIGGDLSCRGGTFKNENGKALNADGIETRGNVFLNDKFTATDEVRLPGAKIGGDLYCGNGLFYGEFILLGAKIGGDLSCTGGTFKNENGKALSADRIETGGNVYLDKGFTATGDVRLPGAKIGGDLYCGNGLFYGEFILLGAKIGGQLSCRGGTFENKDGKALNAERLVVEGTLWLKPKEIKGKIDLMHARAGVLSDNKETWPPKGYLLIDGFDYEKLGPENETPKGAKERLEWINLQPESEDFRPQPYEQLAKVLEEMGHVNDSREVKLAKLDAYRRSKELAWPRRSGLRNPFRFIWDSLRPLWYRFLSLSCRYGWEPRRPVLFMLVMMFLVGWPIFYRADRTGYMIPTRANLTSSAYGQQRIAQPFDPIIYSVDTFLPFVDLHEEKYWLPDIDRDRWGLVYGGYLWIHIILGWISTAIAAVSLSGLLRKE